MPRHFSKPFLFRKKKFVKFRNLLHETKNLTSRYKKIFFTIFEFEKCDLSRFNPRWNDWKKFRLCLAYEKCVIYTKTRYEHVYETRSRYQRYNFYVVTNCCFIRTFLNFRAIFVFEMKTPFAIIFIIINYFSLKFLINNLKKKNL